jgi:alcohol dehydrogenase class IV
LTNAVVMPYVLEWNRTAIADKLARLAAYLGLPQHSFDGVMRWIMDLRREIGIPGTLADLKVKADRIDSLAQQAFDDPSTGGNPLPMTPAGFAQLYRNCIEGRLGAA